MTNDDWPGDELAPEGPPDTLLAWLLLQPSRKAMSDDVERMRLEVRAAMRLLELIRDDPDLATVGLPPRRLIALETRAKQMALQDTAQPLQL